MRNSWNSNNLYACSRFFAMDSEQNETISGYVQLKIRRVELVILETNCIFEPKFI